MRLFAAVAKLIKPVISPNKLPHRFNKWIVRYSSDEFEASTLQTEEMLNCLSNSLTDGEREVLEEVYHQAVKLEVEFSYSRQSMPTELIPVSLMHNCDEERLLLFSDYNFTCSTVDTLQCLVQITLSTAPGSQ